MKLASVFFVAMCAASAAAGQPYSMSELQPASHLKRDVVHSPLPLDKRYEDLTEEQKASLRANYEDMPKGSDPPFPEDGMKPILVEVVKIQKTMQLSGRFYAAIRVDRAGKGRSITVFETPRPELNKLMAAILMKKTRYKPATCSGEPCVMDFPVSIMFQMK